MAKYRPEMKKYYYDPSKYKTYLEQLGIKYPTVRHGRRAEVEAHGGKRAFSRCPARYNSLHEKLIFAVLLALPAAAFAADGKPAPTVHQGRRADLQQELRRVPPADDVRADVADDLRRRAAVGASRSSSASSARHDAAVGRGHAARRVQERSAADASRRSTPSPRGSTAARRRATTRICRRRRRSPKAGRSASPTRSSRWTRSSRFRRPATIPYQVLPRPDGLTEDKWIQAIEIQPSARAQVHHVLAYTQPAGTADRSRAASSGRPTSAASRRTSRASCSSRASRACCSGNSDIIMQMHYTTNGTEAQGSHARSASSSPSSRRRRSRAGGMAIKPRFVIPAGDGNAEVQRGRRRSTRTRWSRASRRTCTCAART